MLLIYVIKYNIGRHCKGGDYSSEGGIFFFIRMLDYTSINFDTFLFKILNFSY